MLTTIHRLSETWFFKGVMIITALSFVSFFGVGGLDEIRKRHDAVISVGDIKISAGDFAVSFSREVERLKKVFGVGFTEKEAIKIGLVPTLIKTKVAEATVAQVAQDLNLSIPNDLAKIKVLNMPEFQNVDGSFNRRAFEYFLSMNRITEAEFLQSLKAEMIENQLFSPTYALAYVPKVMAEAAYKKQFEKRDLQVAVIPFAKVDITAKPTKDELQAYYDSEKDTSFMNPEYRSLSVMVLPFSKIFDAIDVSDEEILARYNENQSRYVKPEVRDVDQMNFADEATANKAMKELNAGKPFRSVAKDIAGQTAEDTHLGEVEKSGVLAEVADDLFAAKKSAVVGPIQSEMGWHIFKVLTITPEVRTPLKKVKGEIKTALQREKGADLVYEESYKIDDFLGSGKTLEEAADKFGLKIQTVPAVDITGKDRKGKPVSDLLSSPDFISVAFGLSKGLESPVTELDSGFFVVRVDDITPPESKPFNEVKDKVVELWLADKKSAKANDIADSIVAGKAVSGFPLKSFKAQGRDSKNLSIEVLSEAFSLGVGEKTKVSSPEGLAVVKVTKIIPADASKNPSGLATVKASEQTELATRMANALLNDFTSRYEVEVDNKSIDSMFSSQADGK